MIDTDKNWLLFHNKNNLFFEHKFDNDFKRSRWGYDFFHKEIYGFEYSKTNCIYEMQNVFIEKNDVVVDLGANVGLFTDYAAKKCKKVIAVEGSAQHFSCLVKNTYENNNIEYLNANVVSEKPKNNTTWGSPSKINMTISDIFDLYDLNYIDFLKVDIELSEYDIFESIDKNILHRIKKIAIETHDDSRNEKLISDINKENFYYFDYHLGGGNKQTTYYFW